MAHTLEPMAEKHRKPVIDIYNHYVEHGFASYREIQWPYEAYDRFLERVQGYPAYVSLRENADVSGFGFLHAWHPSECFVRTAEVTYFLHPEATRQGVGSLFLERFEREARVKGIDRLLACVSTLNQESLAFHTKHGFKACGNFQDIGCKNGTSFGVIWLLKKL